MNRLMVVGLLAGLVLSPLAQADDFHSGTYGMCGADKIIGFKLARAGQIVVGQEVINVVSAVKGGKLLDSTITIPVSGHVADDEHTLMLTIGDGSDARTFPMSATYHDGKLDAMLQGTPIPLVEFTSDVVNACITKVEKYAHAHLRP